MATNPILAKGGDTIYYETGFRNAIEPCLPVLKKKGSDLRSIQIVPALADNYDGDFYGLLTELKIAPHMHWITMRLNDMRSPQEYTSAMTSFITMSAKEMGVLLQMWRTTMRIKV